MTLVEAHSPAPPSVPTAAASAPAGRLQPNLQPSLQLQPLPRAEGARQLPIVLQAESITFKQTPYDVRARK